MMKKIHILLSLILIAVQSACSPENIEENEVKMSVSPSFLEFQADGGMAEIIVTSSEKPRPASYTSWCTVKAGEFVGGKTTVYVTVQPNSSKESRETVVKMICTGVINEIRVCQEGSAGSSGNEPEPGPGPVPEPGNPSMKIGLGWNLGNQMDAHYNNVAEETVWGNPKATQTTFTRLKEYGFTHVRIPVTWLGHFGAAPEYKIEDAWLNRVAEIVGYAENAGLVAVINMHHDGADSAHWLDIKTAAVDEAVNIKVKEQLTAMWTQIAEKFKDKGEFLIFESMNEIHDGGWGWGSNRNDGGKQYRCFNEWQQVFVDAVRSAGGCNETRYLGIPGYCTNTDLTVAHLELPEDTVKDRLMVAVHCYDPYEYCLSAEFSEWGHTAAPGKKASWGDEDNIVSVFQKLYETFVSKGIPVYMGEMGCVNRASEREQAFQQYYLEYYAKVARTYGIIPYIWDNGASGAGEERHAFINHGTGTYCSTGAKLAIEAFLRGMFTEDEDYTLESVYDSAP